MQSGGACLDGCGLSGSGERLNDYYTCTIVQ